MPTIANDVITNAVLSMLFKGKTGTGKSIAGCGKEFRPVYVLDFEDRMRSVINYYKRLDGHCKDVEYDTFPMEGGFFKIDSRMDSLIASCPYKTVCGFSLTSYIHIILKHLILDKVGATRSSGQQAGKKIGGIPVNELEDFNAEDAAIIFELISFFKQLQSNGVNVILEAHITPYEITSIEGKQRTSITVNQILTKGKKAPAQIPGYFDEVYLFQKDYSGMIQGKQETKYSFTSAGTSTDDCKTSHGVEGFDWTGKDFSIELMKQLSQESKDAPRIDPNRPTRIQFGK